MKYKFLFYGMLLGGRIVFITIKLLNAEAIKPDNNKTIAKWVWADSLDAIKAAPLSHRIMYEDSNVRILYVTVNPGKLEPVHTHKWKSLAWAVKNPPFILYHYSLNNNKLVIIDSFTAQLPVNKVNPWDAESPHSIKNIGKDTLILYRIEFKH